MPATTYYATVAELRASTSIPDAPPPSDDTLAELIVEAEDLVDRLVGPRSVDTVSGRKWDAAAGHGLTTAQRTLLTRATVLLAVALYEDPTSFLLPTVGTEKGPDFERTVPLQGREPIGTAVLVRAAELLGNAGLRVLTARLTG